MDSPQFDAWQREQYRKSMDTILVYNPLNEDYICYWDKYPHMVPGREKDIGFGKGKMQLARYIAEKYMLEMKNKIISAKADLILAESKEKRKEKGLSVDPYEVNAEILNAVLKTNDEKQIEEIYKILYVELVKEFGLYDNDVLVKEEKLDQRTPEERIMEKVSSRIEPSNYTKAPTIEDKKEDAVIEPLKEKK